MYQYETIFVLQPELSDEDIDAVIDRVSAIINEAGHVEEVNRWGIRTLAYKIQKRFTEGYYVLMNFEAEPKVLDELEHYYKITDSIIRSIIVSKRK